MVQNSVGGLIRVDLPLGRYRDVIYERIYPNRSNIAYKKGWILEYIRELDCYKWCEDNCEGYFQFTIGTTSEMQLWLNHFYFEFEDKNDALLFKIIWG